MTGYYMPGRAATMYKRNGDSYQGSVSRYGDNPGDPPEPEEFDVESIVVGGVDITEELVGMCKETRQGMCNFDYPDWIDWYIEKNWDRVVEQCSDV